MRTNHKGFPIPTHGNRPDVDWAIVHVRRDKNPYCKDVNLVVMPDGDYVVADSLDNARGITFGTYIKKPYTRHPKHNMLMKAYERDIRQGKLQ